MPKSKTKKHSEIFKCARCSQIFGSRNKLKIHSQKHTDALKEIKLLEQGRLPDETKMGSEFKGKNRVIIS